MTVWNCQERVKGCLPLKEDKDVAKKLDEFSALVFIAEDVREIPIHEPFF